MFAEIYADPVVVICKIAKTVDIAMIDMSARFFDSNIGDYNNRNKTGKRLLRI